MEKINLPQFLLDKGLHQITKDGDIIVVDPLKIAKENNINVYFADLTQLSDEKNISGFIRRKNGKTEIVVEETDIPTRQKFTIAHELGHYFLHLQGNEGDEVYVDHVTMHRDGTYDSKEFQANEFAAEYLMPRLEVQRLYEMYGVTEILSSYFGVSRTAMAIRIDNIIGV